MAQIYTELVSRDICIIYNTQFGLSNFWTLARDDVNLINAKFLSTLAHHQQQQEPSWCWFGSVRFWLHAETVRVSIFENMNSHLSPLSPFASWGTSYVTRSLGCWSSSLWCVHLLERKRLESVTYHNRAACSQFRSECIGQQQHSRPLPIESILGRRFMPHVWGWCMQELSNSVGHH